MAQFKKRASIIFVCSIILNFTLVLMTIDMANSIKTIEEQHTQKTSFLEAKAVSLETSQKILSNTNESLAKENTELKQQVTKLEEELESKPQ